MAFLVGIGQDSHAFSKKKKQLVLGGVKISSENGLQANSDGDVILHALFNAISSALGGRSLGMYADAMCLKEGVTDSSKYFSTIRQMLSESHFKISNISIAVECKKPKIEEHSSGMKKQISTILHVPPSKIGITATSGENLTSFGQGKGIQAFAMVLLESA